MCIRDSAYSDLEGMKELAEGVIKAAARAIGLEGMIDVYKRQGPPGVRYHF